MIIKPMQNKMILSNMYTYWGTIATRNTIDQEQIRQEMLTIVKEMGGLVIDIGPNPRHLTADEAVEQWYDIIDEVEPK
jgi:hypothetical protein